MKKIILVTVAFAASLAIAATINGPVFRGISNTITNAAGPTINFGTTNNPTFSTSDGSIYLSALGAMYVRTNSSWFAVKLN